MKHTEINVVTLIPFHQESASFIFISANAFTELNRIYTIKYSTQQLISLIIHEGKQRKKHRFPSAAMFRNIACQPRYRCRNTANFNGRQVIDRLFCFFVFLFLFIFCLSLPFALGTLFRYVPVWPRLGTIPQKQTPRPQCVYNALFIIDVTKEGSNLFEMG